MEFISKLKAYFSSFLILLFVSSPLVAAEGNDIVVRSGQPVQIATMDMPQFGISTRNAIDLAVAQFGGSLLGHTIKTKHYGKGCDMRQELDGFIQGLIREPKTLGLIGPICSGRTFRIAQTLSDAQILTISPANTLVDFADPEVHSLIPYYFRTAPNDGYQGAAGADFASSPPSQNGLGATTAAIFHYESFGEVEYSESLAQGFRDSFTAAGGTVVGTFAFDPENADFSGILDGLGPVDVVYAPIFENEFFPLYEALRETLGDVPLLGSDGVMGFSLLDVLGTDPIETYASGVIENGPTLDSFTADYTATFGHPPDLFEALAYDATRILLKTASAVARVDSQGTLSISPADMLAYMNDSGNYPYPGAGATYQVPENGDLNPGGWAVYQDVGGDFVPVFP